MITLSVKGHIHDLDEAEFLKLAEAAKEGCPVSKALKGVEIKLNAELDHTH
jgi:osmotically inducible protein OsmC